MMEVVVLSDGELERRKGEYDSTWHKINNLGVVREFLLP